MEILQPGWSPGYLTDARIRALYLQFQGLLNEAGKKKVPFSTLENINIAAGTTLDRKAEKEGRQPDPEIQYWKSGIACTDQIKNEEYTGNRTAVFRIAASVQDKEYSLLFSRSSMPEIPLLKKQVRKS